MRILTLIALATSVLLANVSAQPKSPTEKKDMVGKWVGFETYYYVFYDLKLQADGSGSLVVLNENGSHDTYRVHWAITNSFRGATKLVDQSATKQVLGVQASEVATESIKVDLTSQEFSSRRINLKIAGTFIANGNTNRWNREAVLVKEKDLATKIEESAKHEPKSD